MVIALLWPKETVVFEIVMLAGPVVEMSMPRALLVKSAFVNWMTWSPVPEVEIVRAVEYVMSARLH